MEPRMHQSPVEVMREAILLLTQLLPFSSPFIMFPPFHWPHHLF